MGKRLEHHLVVEDTTCDLLKLRAIDNTHLWMLMKCKDMGELDLMLDEQEVEKIYKYLGEFLGKGDTNG